MTQTTKVPETVEEKIKKFIGTAKYDTETNKIWSDDDLFISTIRHNDIGLGQFITDAINEKIKQEYSSVQNSSLLEEIKTLKEEKEKQDEGVNEINQINNKLLSRIAELEAGRANILPNNCQHENSVVLDQQWKQCCDCFTIHPHYNP